VKRIDAGAKTIIVTTADGTQDAVHFVGRTAVHGADAAAAGSKETLHGINVGSEVAVHYTTTGTQRTAHEIDDVGKTGLRSAEGTVKSIYRGTKTLTLKTADGAEETYRLADRAARDTGQDIGEGAEKSGKVDRLLQRGGRPQGRPLLQENALKPDIDRTATPNLKLKLQLHEYGRRSSIWIFWTSSCRLIA
jgi:hypothetical protein